MFLWWPLQGFLFSFWKWCYCHFDVITFIQNDAFSRRSVVCLYYLLEVFHTAIRYFQCIPVEYGMKGHRISSIICFFFVVLISFIFQIWNLLSGYFKRAIKISILHLLEELFHSFTFFQKERKLELSVYTVYWPWFFGQARFIQPKKSPQFFI